METLKNKLLESLLGDIDDLVGSDSSLIESFLNDNYDIDGSYEIHDDVVDVNGNIKIKESVRTTITRLTDNSFRFGKVDGKFSCAACYKLTTLEGAPVEVTGQFGCSHCRKLKSLKGAPKKVNNFWCMGCNGIKDLTGSPEIVSGDFVCSECENLTSLKGAPKKVDGAFMCYINPKLESLEGAPRIVGGSFVCDSCALKTLKGAPKSVLRFNCSGNEDLISIADMPDKIIKDFKCVDCPSLIDKNIPRNKKVGKIIFAETEE